MHVIFTRIGTVLTAAFILSLGATLAPIGASAHPTIDVAVANWKFTPDKITIPAGEATTLRMTSTSGVHGIQSDDLGLPMTTVPNGKTVLVTFTPKKPGTYVLHCMVFCGPGHSDMKLTVIVTGGAAGRTP